MTKRERTIEAILKCVEKETPSDRLKLLRETLAAAIVETYESPERALFFADTHAWLMKHEIVLVYDELGIPVDYGHLYPEAMH